MLYLIDMYLTEFPDRPSGILDKFRDCPKNLHEMTLDEINKIASTWSPTTAGTAAVYRDRIRYYLEWLQIHGINTNPDIARQINVPVKGEKFLIYSTEDLARYFDVIYNNISRNNIHSGTSIGKEQMFVCHAADILAFYGMTIEQILALNLWDVTPDGVVGYDLPLTKADIDVLMRYKNLKSVGRNTPLLGTKYIRSTKTENPEAKFLITALSRVELSEENEYLHKLLTPTNVYILGFYNRAYEKELQLGKFMNVDERMPKWFIEVFDGLHANAATLTAHKKKYAKYREERDLATPKPVTVTKQLEVTEQPKANNNDIKILTARLDVATKTLKALVAEIEDIKAKLGGIV